jgi:hypothetical protein
MDTVNKGVVTLHTQGQQYPVSLLKKFSPHESRDGIFWLQSHWMQKTGE